MSIYADALRDLGPSTARELAEFLDMPPDNVRMYLARHPRRFRIIRWERGTRRLSAVWCLSNGQPNAPRPPDKTGAERQAAYRERRGLALAVKRRSKPASPWSAFL